MTAPRHTVQEALENLILKASLAEGHLREVATSQPLYTTAIRQSLNLAVVQARKALKDAQGEPAHA